MSSSWATAGWTAPSRLDCPEVESAVEHSTDLLAEKSLDAYADGFRRLRRAARRREGVDLAGYSLPQQVEDLEAVAEGARLRPHRPPQRERRDAHGDDLRLALPGEHPPLGDDQRQSTRPLPLGREDDRRADPALLGALRGGRRVRQSHGRPRRAHGADGRPRPAGSSSRSRTGNVRVASFFGLMETTHGERAALRPDDVELVAGRRGRRRERVLVPVACRRLLLPEAFVWGEYAAVGPIDAGATRRLLCRREQSDGFEPRRCGDEVHLGRRPAR